MCDVRSILFYPRRLDWLLLHLWRFLPISTVSGSCVLGQVICLQLFDRSVLPSIYWWLPKAYLDLSCTLEARASLVPQLVKNPPAMQETWVVGRSSAEGNAYPLQYSGLKCSMDCIAHSVAKSRNWAAFTFTFGGKIKATLSTPSPMADLFPQHRLGCLLSGLWRGSVTNSSSCSASIYLAPVCLLTDIAYVKVLHTKFMCKQM